MREAAALVGRRLLCWWQLVARGGSRRQSAAGHPLRASRPVFLNVTHRSILWACSSGIGGGLARRLHPRPRKAEKLHSGRIPQAGTTEPAHWRVIEFSEAIKKSGQPVPCVGVAARLVALWVRYSALAGGVCRRTHGNIWRCRRGRNPRRLQDPQCLPCAPCRSPGNGCKRCPAQ